jgi:hypothetical protein
MVRRSDLVVEKCYDVIRPPWFIDPVSSVFVFFPGDFKSQDI